MRNWLYFLLTKEGKSLYVDPATGEVGQTSQNVPLTHTPDGWQDITVGFERDTEKLGSVRQFTFPLKAVVEGATILRKIVYTHGLHYKVFLLIVRRTVTWTATAFDDVFKKFYRGQVQLTSMVDESDTFQFKCEEEGLVRQVKANEATKYEFDLADPEAITIAHDGMLLTQKNNFLITRFAYKTWKPPSYLVDVGQSSHEGEAIGFAGASNVFGTPVDFSRMDWAGSIDWIFYTDIAIPDMRIVGEAGVESNDGRARGIGYHLWLQSSTGQKVDLLKFNEFEHGRLYPFDVRINSGEKEKWYLCSVNSGFGNSIQMESRFRVEFASRGGITGIKAFLPAVLLDKLLEKIGGKRGLSSSTLLNTFPFSDFALTSGDGIRALEGAKIKLSLEDFRKIFRVCARAGAGVHGEKYHLEDISFFLRQDNAVQLGNIGRPKVTAAKDLMGNTIKIGWREPQVENVNGKFAFNGAHIYSTMADEEIRELNYVAPCYADPYHIERVRLNFEGKQTTDGEADNDVFLIHVKKAAIDLLKTTLTGNTTGVLMDSINRHCTVKVLTYVSTPSSAFTANAERTEFTFQRTTPMAFKSSFWFQVSDGVRVIGSIKVNGVAVAQQFGVGAGLNPIIVTADLNLKKGDRLTFEVDGVSQDFFTRNVIIGLESQGTTAWTLYRHPFTEIRGIPAGDSAFNIAYLTPKRLLQLWKPWFNSVLWGLQGTRMKFESTERNRELYTRDLGPIWDFIVDEDGEEEVTGDIIFKPFWLEVSASADGELPETLADDPYRPFAFSWDEGYRGATAFYWKIGFAPDDDQEQVFKLLCAPGTDTKHLIE